MIPMLFRINLERKDKRPVRLWLPLFLVWLVIIPFAVCFGPLLLVAAWAVKRRGRGKIVLFAYPLLLSALWALSGLAVEIEGENTTVSLKFI